MAVNSAANLPYLEIVRSPTVAVPGNDAPVKRIDGAGLRTLGERLDKLFGQYRSDRRIQELRWLRNLRQYLGYYDPEVERQLAPDRSKAYPKVTRVKCISMLARIMDLMFPSDDKNWTINARPSPNMDINDVKAAIAKAQARDKASGQTPPVDLAYVMAAVQDLATERAVQLSTEISDQLQELGGDQTYDYVAINNEVVASGILYGLGVARGPYVREVKSASWFLDPKTGQPKARTVTSYMPVLEHMSIWDYYPDMSAKRLEDGDGYFVRQVLSKQQLRKLADRSDFLGDQIKAYLKTYPIGNYKAQEFETELRGMGVREAVNDQKAETTKYEVLAWHGPIDGTFLRMAGVEVDDDKLADQIDAEVWTLAGRVIKATMNPWKELKTDVRTIHHFVFDKDDTAPIGFGLPNILRDTQMSISAATRMLMDNASVVCGPILEVNTALMQAGQDLGAVSAYKTYYRDDEGATAQWPAVRDVKIESHIDDLEKIIELFMKMADTETFVGPMTGGDTSKMPSEPMRNAAGASMLMGNAALPFKQIIRNFDRFTQSVIQSLVMFNMALNEDKVKVSDYDVIARGATSLIAKEVRGMQVDQLATSLTPEEKMHVDTRKLVTARFAVRDLSDMLVSESTAASRQAASDAQASATTALTQALQRAQERVLLSTASKNLAGASKSSAAAQADAVNTALDIMQSDLTGQKHVADMANAHADTLGKLAGAQSALTPDDPNQGPTPDDPQAGGGSDQGLSSPAGGGPTPDGVAAGGLLGQPSGGTLGGMPAI